MNADEMLCRWAAAKLDEPVEDVLHVTFEHEDGWADDSGTYWPEQNTAVVTLRSTARGEPKRPRERKFAATTATAELLREIIEAGS